MVDVITRSLSVVAAVLTRYMLQVCIKACTQEERYCEPLLSWSIRLDTELVKHKEYIAAAWPGQPLPPPQDEQCLAVWQIYKIGRLPFYTAIYLFDCCRRNPDSLLCSDSVLRRAAITVQCCMLL